tara:strand:- start:1279 stop:1497 length:219 start_codon:yes stop_codon:yes gene_type:complete
MIRENTTYFRLHQLCFDMAEVESIEWKRLEEEPDNPYSVRIHLKSGKQFTRQLFEQQFKQLKEQFKHQLGDE